jgi:pimeloyl-ACP methyl ester carboxylesterase
VTSAYITRPVRAEVLDRWAADAAMISESVLDESLRICTDESFADRAAALRTPTLVVAGVHDPIFSPEMLQQTVVGTITGARMAVVDSNHEIPIEAPRELAGLISAFVAGLDPLR